MNLQLTEDEIFDFGNFCEALMTSDTFSALADRFKLEQFSAFLATQPIEKREREKIYDTVDGFDQFCVMMKRIIMERNKLLEDHKQQALSSHHDDDAHFQEEIDY